MSFVRIRTINGKQYAYLEYRFRRGKKVKSRSVYLGPAGFTAGGAVIERMLTADSKRAEQDKARDKARAEEAATNFQKQTGLQLQTSIPNPVVPIEKQPSVEKASPPEQSPSQSADTSSAEKD